MCGGFFRCSALGSELRNIFALVTDNADIQKALNIVSLFEERFKQRAGDRSLLVESGFIRLIREKDIADRYGIALMFMPFRNDTAFNRLSLSRHNYRCCHKITSLMNYFFMKQVQRTVSAPLYR